MSFKKVLPLAVAAAMLLSACAAAATAVPTAAPPAPAKATDVPKAVVNNPPKTAAEVDAITLTKDKPTEILFWHRYTGRTYSTVLEIVNDFNTKNPYGISVKLENAGASYDDVFNKVNGAIAANAALPDVVIAYQNQAATYRDLGKAVNLKPSSTARSTV